MALNTILQVRHPCSTLDSSADSQASARPLSSEYLSPRRNFLAQFNQKELRETESYKANTLTILQAMKLWGIKLIWHCINGV